MAFLTVFIGDFNLESLLIILRSFSFINIETYREFISPFVCRKNYPANSYIGAFFRIIDPVQAGCSRITS